MARGWESKSVEGQLADAESATLAGPKKVLTPAEAEAQRQRELLALTRDRIMQLLSQTTNDRYRNLLVQELRALEEKLATLS